MAKKILVIDDEDILTRTFKRLLEKQGYAVTLAAESQAAYQLIQNADFDLILSDIRMPGTNGVESYSQMVDFWNSRKKKWTPVIFLTGYADQGLEELAQKFTPLAYIYKPFDAIKLLEIIKKNLA